MLSSGRCCCIGNMLRISWPSASLGMDAAYMHATKAALDTTLVHFDNQLLPMNTQSIPHSDIKSHLLLTPQPVGGCACTEFATGHTTNQFVNRTPGTLCSVRHFLTTTTMPAAGQHHAIPTTLQCYCHLATPVPYLQPIHHILASYSPDSYDNTLNGP